MYLLKFLFLFIPISTFAQQKTQPKFDIHDFSNSRFNISDKGFLGVTKVDTGYYTDKRIASIGGYAVTKNSVVSGLEYGLMTRYYHNGHILSQGSYGMYSLLYYQSKTTVSRSERSYKVGKWIYYYENGRIKAIGTYKISSTKANTGIDNQFYKSPLTTDDWKFFNVDGSKATNREKIIAEIEHNPNCG